MESAEMKQPSLGNVLAMELGMECATLRKMIERLPQDKFDWQPHEKSMTLGRLANHCVDMVKWINSIIESDRLDFAANPYDQPSLNFEGKLLEELDKNLKEAEALLNGASNEAFFEMWTLCEGDNVFFSMPRAAVVRGFVLSHIIHHRGQLSVYMRLLDIPVPSIYGPSADEAM